MVSNSLASDSYFADLDAFIVILVIENPYLESFARICDFWPVHFPYQNINMTIFYFNLKLMNVIFQPQLGDSGKRSMAKVSEPDEWSGDRHRCRQAAARQRTDSLGTSHPITIPHSFLGH